jgi:tetratricopeptide (TPR) repeat protein
MSKLDSRINQVEKSARDDDPHALTGANELVDAFPGEWKVWSLRAYIHARSENLSAALVDISRAISLSPNEPVLFFDRGRYRMKSDDSAGAVEDFRTGLELCDQYNDDYYRESLYFLRAEAFVGLGKKAEALADLAHVRDGFTIWTTKLQSKDELLSACR